MLAAGKARRNGKLRGTTENGLPQIEQPRVRVSGVRVEGGVQVRVPFLVRVNCRPKEDIKAQETENDGRAREVA